MAGSQASGKSATKDLAKSASAPTLESLATAKQSFRSMESAMDFSKFDTRERELLKTFAHRRSRKVLRDLSFPDIPKAGKNGRVRVQSATPADRTKKPDEKKAAVAITRSPLEFALGKGAEAEAARRFIYEARKPLAEDEATSIYNEVGTLDWLEADRLQAELTEVSESALNRLSQAQYHNETVRTPVANGDRCQLEASQVPAGDVIAATGIFGAGVKSLRAGRRPLLASIRWPSEERFDKFYHPPEELQPPMRSPKFKETQALPEPRKTISCLEDSTSPGIQSYIYWQFVNTKDKEAESVAQKTKSDKPVGMFEAGAMYRHSCVQLGVPGLEMIEPRPIFGESVEVKTLREVGTRQCYAVAEAVRACMPRQMNLSDTVMTDMGVARIVESAVLSGRLETLCITGTCLSYRFCTALYNALRTRAGNSLTEIILRGCGLGNYLDVEPVDLPPLVASTYIKCMSALPEGIIDPAPDRVDADLPRSRAASKFDTLASMMADEQESASAEEARSESKRKMSKKAQEKADADEEAERVRKQEAEADAEEEAERRRQKQKDKKKRGASFHEESDAEEDNILPELQEIREPSWWDMETAPSRPIPVALPIILHIARPGSTIRRVDLSTSALTLEMCRGLGWALSNSQMEALTLDRCCIGDDSLSALTEGLGQNRTLLELSLRHNNLSGAPRPVAELIHIAGRHASLAHWDFAENPIHPDCIIEITRLMEFSCSVLAMHLLGQGVTGPDAKQVAVDCRTWINANRLQQIASTKSGNRDDSDEEDTFGEDEEELILCRARHVEALRDWRICSPVVLKKKKKVDGSLSSAPEVVTAPLSWMPSGCWVCSKCATVDFRWVVPDRGEGDDSGGTGSRLFVRPSFANFDRVELQRERSEGSSRVVFWAEAVVPPGFHSYIFESQTEPDKGRPSGTPLRKVLMCARDQSSCEVASVTAKNETLLDLCKEYAYGGRMNTLPPVKESDFKIPEHLEGMGDDGPETDAWAEDPIRVKILSECYQVDMPLLHLDEICHVEEEEEVRETIWEMYGFLYDTYSMYAGRSLWPLIRQVDVYSFFEEASLLDRGPLATDGYGCSDGALASAMNATEKAEAATQRRASLAQSYPKAASSQEPASPGGGGSSPSLSVASQQKGKVKFAAGSGAAAASAASEAMAQSKERMDTIHPLSTQDIQQMIVQTITRRKNHVKHDATWSQKRKHMVIQRTREGAPITRPQFVEVLLRAAVALRGREPSTAAALRKFTDNILSGRIMQPPLSPFPRGLSLKAGVVRETLLARRKALRQAYERFGSNETSFQRLAQLLKLCDRSFTAKHVASIYALSRRPIKYPSPQSSTLNYDEFSEAVARLALVWQPTVGGAITSNPGTVRGLPPQPQVGQPVNQRAVANRLEAFLERLTERMKPTVVSRF